MTHRPMAFYDVLSHDREAKNAYRGLTEEKKRALLTRAAHAESTNELRLLVLSLENRTDAREWNN